MFIILVFRSGCDKSVSCFFYCLSQGISHGMDSSLRGGWMIFHFWLFKSILFFVNWNSLCFFHFLYSTNMLFLLLLYSIGFNTLDLLLFLRRISTVLSQVISYGMWLLALEFLLFKSVLHFTFLHLLSGYYYYDYVVICVLRPSWLTEIHCWIVKISSTVVKF